MLVPVYVPWNVPRVELEDGTSFLTCPCGCNDPLDPFTNCPQCGGEQRQVAAEEPSAMGAG